MTSRITRPRGPIYAYSFDPVYVTVEREPAVPDELYRGGRRRVRTHRHAIVPLTRERSHRGERPRNPSQQEKRNE